MLDRLKKIIGDCLSRDLILDLYDAVSARALAAHEMIRDHADLDEKRARMVVGRVRFPMQERSFEDVCDRHGGSKLDCDVMPGTDLKFFQPFYRFACDEAGVVLGFASMPEKGCLPAENMSRKAGVAINFDLVPRLDFDGTGPKTGDIYVLFLVARDPMRPGQVSEVAIGIVDAEYDSYLFYEAVEEFFAGYAKPPESSPAPTGGEMPLVRLKASAKPFQAPEKKEPDEGEHTAG